MHNPRKHAIIKVIVLLISREQQQQHAINKISDIANSTADANVKLAAIHSIENLASNRAPDESDTANQPSFYTRFVEPVGLNMIASFLWEQGIKKAAAWLATTLFSANMVIVSHDTLHVALNSLLS